MDWNEKICQFFASKMQLLTTRPYLHGMYIVGAVEISGFLISNLIQVWNYGNSLEITKLVCTVQGQNKKTEKKVFGMHEGWKGCVVCSSGFNKMLEYQFVLNWWNQI